MASIMHVEHESTNTMKRATKEGKQLTYELAVIQQPERARACGSGAKYPPPVVQLQVFEGEEKKDITFAYNANFFLFTTLEPARPIAQPRVHTVQQTLPVLTGMPVAGMAYLDRPNPAGYFIFPDLSVRHEGKYRLNFNLYEEVKEAKDEDARPASANATTDKMFGSPNAPQAHMHFRLEVRSKPFTVFSAKKFPGLAESTHISRVVAEQGCRVRIRRDVRMRRRDTKSGKGYDDYGAEEDGYARSERYITPELYNRSQAPDRPRSVSNGSVHGSVQVGTPYSTDSRRLSQQEVSYFNQQPYQQQSLPPPPPVQPSHPGFPVSHLHFGSSTSNQYQVPTIQSTSPAVPPPPSQGYNPLNNNYTHQPPPRPVSTSHVYGYSPSAMQPQQQYSQSPTYADNSQDYRLLTDYRRQSAPLNAQSSYPAQRLTNYGQMDTRPQSLQQPYHTTSMQQSVPRSMTPHGNGQSLPPLSTIHLEKKYEPPTPASAFPTSSVSANQSYDGSMNKCAQYIPTPQSAGPVSADTSRIGKRSFGSVFDSSHLDRPMHGGMRPGVIDQGREVPQVEAEDGSKYDEYDLEGMTKLLTYRRADGTRQIKKCVSPISDE
ncbi:MAG: hypothetical protein Q9220_005584 [cf. Caloplaca sp. 1 TL-2023]